MDQLAVVADAVVGGAGAIVAVAATVAALTTLLFLLQTVRGRPLRRHSHHGFDGPSSHGGGHDDYGGGHNDYGHGHGYGHDLDFELGSISEKLDRIAAAVEPKGWGLLRRIGSNVFWSVFGVAAGLAIEALWPVASYY